MRGVTTGERPDGLVSIGSSATAEQVQELRKEISELRKMVKKQDEELRALRKSSGQFEQFAKEAKYAIRLLVESEPKGQKGGKTVLRPKGD